MEFHWTVTLGNVIEAFALILSSLIFMLGVLRAMAQLIKTLIMAHQQNVSRLDKIEQKFELIYQWWKRQIGINGYAPPD